MVFELSPVSVNDTVDPEEPEVVPLDVVMLLLDVPLNIVYVNVSPSLSVDLVDMLNLLVELDTLLTDTVGAVGT